MLFSFFLFYICFAFALYFLYTIIIVIQKPKKAKSINQTESYQYNNVFANEECTICHERIKNKVELACEHCFCGQCLLNEHSNSNSIIKCDICHKESQCVILDNIIVNENTKSIIVQLAQYNLCNLANPFSTMIHNIHFIFKYSIQMIFNDEKSIISFLVCSMLSLLYFLFPYDLIYDGTNFFGYLDDLIILITMYLYIIYKYYNQYIQLNIIRLNNQ